MTFPISHFTIVNQHTFEQMDKRIANGYPFFELRVDDPEGGQEVLTYIDTSEQGMLYDPETLHW